MNGAAAVNEVVIPNEPPPRPSEQKPTGPGTAPAETLQGVGSTRLPQTAAIVWRSFPEADDEFFEQLWTLCNREFKSIPAKLRITDQILDSDIAAAVQQCHRQSQRTQGLFLKTVPACIRTWARGGKP
jgi:hypothetical protein